jgi:UDP-3-O-[3-hydroxymyristoyl] N-acetylglucosamine deacetylase/3-hydroxyacyl-[acyl-carrier-protein] dehydratase
MITEPKKKTYINEKMAADFNPDRQHTLQSEASISGTGIHTGVQVDMILKPAAPNFGIQFQRIDLAGSTCY